ncbi:MAG: pyruvate formate lyase family protein, partial [Oscillospiraceae bacterium]|nr:pyruvate formate lyase family protein [Oscillospiraceae bacterium]
MYKFKPIAPRIERMREKIRDRVLIADADKLYWGAEAEAKYKSFPPVIAKPMQELYIIERMTIEIEEDEYFVGDVGNQHWGECNGFRWLPANIEEDWPIEADGLHHAPDCDEYSHQKFAVSPAELKRLRQFAEKMAKANDGIRAETWFPEGAEEYIKLQAETYGRPNSWGPLLPPGHLTPGFQHILRQGYGAIRKQAQDWMDERKGNIMGADMDKYMFYKAATVACDGAILLTRRYAD